MIPCYFYSMDGNSRHQVIKRLQAGLPRGAPFDLATLSQFGVSPQLAAHYAEAGPPKGEIAVVVGPPGGEPALSAEELDRRLAAALAEGSLRDAVDRVATECGLPRKQVYARALERGKGN